MSIAPLRDDDQLWTNCAVGFSPTRQTAGDDSDLGIEEKLVQAHIKTNKSFCQVSRLWLCC